MSVFTWHGCDEHREGVINDMVFLDLQGMKRPTGGGGGSRLSVTGCNGESGISLLLCN